MGGKTWYGCAWLTAGRGSEKNRKLYRESISSQVKPLSHFVARPPKQGGSGMWRSREKALEGYNVASTGES
jgi:hypothetical protein